MQYVFAISGLITCIAFGCSPTRESPKFQLLDGTYKVKSSKGKNRAYIQVLEDSILSYPFSEKKDIDTSDYEIISLEKMNGANSSLSYRFSKPSFDLDFISIPLKFRPGTSSFPKQLTSSINGAIYVGRRVDVYHLKRTENRLRVSSYVINHYGASFGAFTGLGSTPINAWVTNGAVNIEYDGLVLPIGVTALIAFNNFTFGLATGVDQLMDKNRKSWIYRRKPWIGLTLGLNLN
jgi:hypothetical protein